MDKKKPACCLRCGCRFKRGDKWLKPTPSGMCGGCDWIVGLAKKNAVKI